MFTSVFLDTFLKLLVPLGFMGLTMYIDQPGGVVQDGGAADDTDDGNTDTGGDTGGDNTGGDDSGDGDTGGDDSGDDDTGDNDSGDDDTGGDDSGDSDNGDINTRIDNLTNQFQEVLAAIGSLTNKGGDDGTGGSGTDKSGEVASKLLSLEHDELVSLIAEDPKKFITDLTTDLKQVVMSDVSNSVAAKEYERQIEGTIEAYAEQNNDFEAMWNKGDIQKFMDKNPGHNAISAHMMLTMENRIKEAREEGRKQAIKDIKTKKDNQVIGGGKTVPRKQLDAALKDTSKHGGAASVVAQRAGLK